MIRYTGPAPFVGLLASMLRNEGFQVEYEPPEEPRDLSGLAGSVGEGVLVELVVTGGALAIKAVVARFRERQKTARVEFEADDD